MAAPGPFVKQKLNIVVFCRPPRPLFGPGEVPGFVRGHSSGPGGLDPLPEDLGGAVLGIGGQDLADGRIRRRKVAGGKSVHGPAECAGNRLHLG